MLIREDERGLLLIGQPSHAWLSGQLARAWGNERFGEVRPLEEVCLAAEQHDIGWGWRDLKPLFDPEAGRPLSFMEMPLAEHLEIFSRGPERMLSQSRYAALLVSRHGWRLYSRRDLDRLPAGDAQAIRSFLRAQEEFQRQLLAALRADPASAALAEDGLVERNSMLIWTWDYLSLALCLNWSPALARRAPTADGEVDLELVRGEDPWRWRLDPWPFARTVVEVGCEGRRLDRRSPSEAALREAFARARWETLEFRLEPRRDRHG
jgi:hypothetical protein